MVILMRQCTASSLKVSWIQFILIMSVSCRSLYDLEQAPRAWYQRFATYIRQLGFVSSASDTSLFVYKDGASIAYLLLYVDDIVLTTLSSTFLQDIIGRLHTEFAMTDLGVLHHFLGISITRSSDGLFLSQQ